MKNIGEWIESIVEDLVTPDKKLSEILYKVQVLAHRMKNEELKQWVDGELNGYIGKETPEYRTVPSEVLGNLIQNAGFNILTRNNVPLPVEYLEEKYWKMLLRHSIVSKVAELERMAAEGSDVKINLPHAIYSLFTDIISNWAVDTACQRISINSIVGILSTVRSTLLNFLLELQTEFGERDYSKIFEKEATVDKIYRKTIGSISGNQIHISVGDENVQTTNYGDSSKFNINTGDKVNQTVNESAIQDISEFIKSLRSQIGEIGLEDQDKEDLSIEIERIEKQIEKEKPKKNIVKSGLKVVYDILSGVAGNVVTQPFIETVKTLLENI